MLGVAGLFSLILAVSSCLSCYLNSANSYDWTEKIKQTYDIDGIHISCMETSASLFYVLNSAYIILFTIICYIFIFVCGFKIRSLIKKHQNFKKTENDMQMTTTLILQAILPLIAGCVGFTGAIASMFSITESNKVDLLLPAICDDGQIQLVQVFFRHGERSPTTFVKFPNEPDSILENFPYEHGELTNRGIQQEFTLGSNLREEYAKLVEYKYRSSQLRVYTGLDNRTITSAQTVLASFLPPTPDQQWNAIPWQPIPVVTQPIIDHVSFGIFDHCPALKETIINEPVTSTKNGRLHPDLYIFQKVLDGVKTRKMLDYLLPLPTWYASSGQLISEIDKMQDDLHTKFIDAFVDSIGGWHYDQILGKMDDSINNRTKHKIVFYSGHDTNTLTVGRFLNIDKINYALPPFTMFRCTIIPAKWHEDCFGNTCLFISMQVFKVCILEKSSKHTTMGGDLLGISLDVNAPCLDPSQALS
uniref:Uncharacterized protein n=1 Tax=Ditylenchus dipsaci TaxID=166011 RepID=A0A915ER48_9BILA